MDLSGEALAKADCGSRFERQEAIGPSAARLRNCALRVSRSAPRRSVAPAYACISVLLIAIMFLAAPPVRAGVSMGTIEDDPETVKARIRKKVEDDFKEGMKAKAEGDMASAVRLLLWCAKTRCDTQYPEMAYNELTVIHGQATKELQVARDLLNEDAAAALSELKRIVRIYMGLGPAKDAGILLRQLDADPKFQATLKAGRLAEDLKKAQTLEAQALLAPPAKVQPEKPAIDPPPAKTDPPAPKPESIGAVTVKTRELTEKERKAAAIDKLVEAYDLYGRIVQQGPDTEAGKKAAEARARLAKDAGLMARLTAAQAERKAREWMGLADGYFKAGRFDPAREYCFKIINQCPQTPQAAEAKALLEHMK